MKRFIKTGSWKEIGSYQAIFSNFGTDIYANEVVRSCIRALAEHSSKANVKVVRRVEGNKVDGDKLLERMIQYRPNLYMSGKDFISKVRTRLEIDNTAFIYIQRNEFGKCIGLYPMPKASHEALESAGELFIQFRFINGNTMTIGWEDLAVLRKDYNESDIFGDSNAAILTSLELLQTTNDGLKNAIQSTANLRGILKSTKAMIDPADVKKQKEQFVKDYLNVANEGGIASMDATQDFIPITMQPTVANYKHIEEFRNNIYRYFGVNDDILMSKAFGDAWEAFYESRLEPFLLALGLELTNKIFSDREKGFGNEIIFEANRLAYASTTTKMAMVSLIDRGVITINEYREVLNLSPVEGGDVRVIRKEYAEASNLNEIQGVGAGDNVDETGVINKTQVIDDAESVVGKSLNGAQTQSLITIVTQFANGLLTIGQAVNIIAISIGVSKAEAQALLEGAV